MKKGNNTISLVMKGLINIQAIKKGLITVYEAFKELIKNGIPPLTLTKCKGTDLIDYKIYGESVQDGTPTPETPIEVESVGDKTKNLFNINNVIKQYGDCDVIVEDNAVTITAIGTLGAQFASNYVKNLNETKNYTLSFKAKKIVTGVDNKTILRVAVAGSNDDLSYTNLPLVGNSNPIVDTEYSFSYTVTGYKHYRFYIYNNNVGEGIIGEKTQYYDIQLQEGTTATKYESYGYRIPVKASGKNLFDGIFEKGIISAANGNNYDHDTIIRSKNFTLVDELTEYTFSSEDSNVDSIYLYEFGSDYSLLSHTVYSMTNSKVTIITQENTKYIRFSPRDRVTNVTLDLDIKVQLEEGNTATNYEPYKEPLTTNIYLKEPLRKIGDYADYIDFESGKVVRKIATKVFDGTESLSAFDSNTAGNCPYPYTYYLIGNAGLVIDDICLCSHLELQTNFSYQREGNNKFRILNSLSNGQSRFVFRFYLDGVIVEDVAKVKELLTEYYNNGNPMIVYYAHAKGLETEETIELPNIPTLKGTTILSIDSKINSSYMEVVYEGMGNLELLSDEDNLILNNILSTDTETTLNITNTEINQILDEIIGG